VARFRKTAIAAVALSTLVVTSGVAYADHDHRGVSVSSYDSGMTWAYSDTLIDYTKEPPNSPEAADLFADAKASAVMIGMNGKSFFRLRVTGINARGGVYGVHLHQGTCVAGDWDAAKKHYNVTWNNAATLPALVSSKTEVWLDLNVNLSSNAKSTATVDFIPEIPEGERSVERSIVLHALETKLDGTAGDRLACMPFTIKKTG
jgi:hypothetical protein